MRPSPNARSLETGQDSASHQPGQIMLQPRGQTCGSSCSDGQPTPGRSDPRVRVWPRELDFTTAEQSDGCKDTHVALRGPPSLKRGMENQPAPASAKQNKNTLQMIGLLGGSM